MNVRELIELLQKEDGERLVVLAIDEEGNGFRPLADVATAAYRDGETGIEELTDEFREQGFSEEDVMRGIPAVVLWP